MITADRATNWPLGDDTGSGPISQAHLCNYSENPVVFMFAFVFKQLLIIISFGTNTNVACVQ